MKIGMGKREILIDGYPVGLTLFLTALAVIYYVSIVLEEDGPESVLFIKPVLIVLLVCGAGIVYQGIRVRPRPEAHTAPRPERGEKLFTRKRIYFLILMVAYAALLKPLGFFLPTFAFLVAAPVGMGIRNWKVLIAFSIGLAALYVYIFSNLFNVPVPIWPGQD